MTTFSGNVTQRKGEQCRKFLYDLLMMVLDKASAEDLTDSEEEHSVKDKMLAGMIKSTAKSLRPLAEWKLQRMKPESAYAICHFMYEGLMDKLVELEDILENE